MFPFASNNQALASKQRSTLRKWQRNVTVTVKIEIKSLLTAKKKKPIYSLAFPPLMCDIPHICKYFSSVRNRMRRPTQYRYTQMTVPWMSFPLKTKSVLIPKYYSSHRIIISFMCVGVDIRTSYETFHSNWEAIEIGITKFCVV